MFIAVSSQVFERLHGFDEPLFPVLRRCGYVCQIAPGRLPGGGVSATRVIHHASAAATGV